MPEESDQELPIQARLPVVDREATRKLLHGDVDEVMDRFSEFYKTQPTLEETILLSFANFADEEQTAIYIGVGVTGALLADSQSRTSGFIPQEISEGAIEASIKSMQEGKMEADDLFKELFDSDQELFFALTLLSNKLKEPPSLTLQSGYLLLKIYEHILEGKQLENKLGF